MKLFFQNIKDEIISKKKFYIPTLIISGIFILFSLIYVGFKISQESNQGLTMVVVIPLITLLILSIAISSVIYFIHRIPAMKRSTYAIVISGFLSLVTASKLSYYDMQVYTHTAISISVFVVTFAIIYFSVKE